MYALCAHGCMDTCSLQELRWLDKHKFEVTALSRASLPTPLLRGSSACLNISATPVPHMSQRTLLELDQRVRKIRTRVQWQLTQPWT